MVHACKTFVFVKTRVGVNSRQFPDPELRSFVFQAEVLLTLEEACEEKPTRDFGPLFAKVRRSSCVLF